MFSHNKPFTHMWRTTLFEGFLVFNHGVLCFVIEELLCIVRQIYVHAAAIVIACFVNTGICVIARFSIVFMASSTRAISSAYYTCNYCVKEDPQFIIVLQAAY